MSASHPRIARQSAPLALLERAATSARRAPLWGLAAVVAPWMIRRRSLVGDTLRVIAWAVIVVSATMLSPELLDGGQRLGPPPTALVGALAGAGLTLAPSLIVAGLALYRSPGSKAGLA